MASNREERLQMRQRGAGTRRIKEVNFGFSFGLAPATEEAAPQPADVDTTIEPHAPPSVPSASENTQAPLSLPEIQPPSSKKHVPLQRTPGGARNSLPERPSTFDIPDDDALDLGRSGKRRKIEPPTRTSPTSADQEIAQHEKRDSPDLQNGTEQTSPVLSEPKELRDESPAIPNPADTPQTEQILQETLDSTTAMVPDNPAPEAPPLADEHPDRSDANQKSPEAQREPPEADRTPVLEDTAKGKHKQRGSSADQRRSQRVEGLETANDSIQPLAPQEPPSEVNRDQITEAESPRSQPEKRPRDRPQTSTQSSPATDGGSAHSEAASTESVRGESISTQQQTTERPRGRKAKQPMAVPIASETSNGQPLDEDNAPEEGDTDSHESSRQLRQKSSELNHEPKQVGRPGKKSSEQLESVEASKPAGEKKGRRKRSEPEQQPEPGLEEESEAPKEPEPIGKKKRRRRRSEQEPEPQLETEPDAQREPEAPKESNPIAKKRTRRKRPDQEREPEPEVSKVPEPLEKTKRRKRSSLEPEPEPEPEAELEPGVSKEQNHAAGKRKRGKRSAQKQESEPEAEPEPGPETSKEPEPPLEKRKRRKRSAQEQEPESEPEPETPKEQKAASEKRRRRRLEQEPEPEPEPERPPDAPREPKPTSVSKRGRGRPSLSNKPPEETQPEEDPTVRNEHGEEAPRSARRKARQPRGETVPVTVHRLANAASLGGYSQPSELSDEEEESADELSTRRKTKLPNRGGVNVADVLSQICRETLEKTLTTLKNGISNENNAARRSEWTTKKKAVEAFGTELEGRLLELSEMLDSNFMLGVSLKKAKREMLDMRSRLYQLRKQREGVALQMDAVRRKHSEEENASLARSNINHSLHSLNLALERGQNRPAGDSDEEGSSDPLLTVGLEFMLRSVAENVSSRAPGAQGGLLSQIKAFNAQLEAAARTLES
ncbi:hypothetical protein ETB97_001787 [Aspergillus alliaceus]|uniref:Inner kinetochore subunit AME1 domain-containing protein n=1 Tax=Petromyces alliaceus TaxID=209559 RepID=A0A8H6E6G5_PETAA|nr:hypothetical protein ETB97_001787 [Aspergillus burnettii]